MKKVEIKIIRSDKKEFIADNTNWKIISIDGIDAPKNVIYSKENAVGDGITITNSHLLASDLIIQCNSNNYTINNLNRTEVLRFFNPKFDFKIQICYLTNQKWCNAKLYSLNAPTNNINRGVSFSVQFIREGAYWLSVDEYARDIASVDNMFGYSLYDIENIGFAYDVFNFSKNVVINNDGDVECYCRAVITSDGDVINPIIKKNKDAIKILDTITVHDTYIIDFNKLTVQKNNINAINKIDKSSHFTNMQFDIGRNIISYSAENGEHLLHIRLYFNKLYLGV